MQAYVRVLPGRGAGAATVELHLPPARAGGTLMTAVVAAAAARTAGFASCGLAPGEWGLRWQLTRWERAYAPGVLDEVDQALRAVCELVGLQGARSVADELLEYAAAGPATPATPARPRAPPPQPAAIAPPPYLPPRTVSLRLDRQRGETYVFGAYEVKDTLKAAPYHFLWLQDARCWAAPALLEPAAMLVLLRPSVLARSLRFETTELPLAAALAAADGAEFVPCGGRYAVLCGHGDVCVRRVVGPEGDNAGREYYSCPRWRPASGDGSCTFVWAEDVEERAEADAAAEYDTGYDYDGYISGEDGEEEGYDEEAAAAEEEEEEEEEPARGEPAATPPRRPAPAAAAAAGAVATPAAADGKRQRVR